MKVTQDLDPPFYIAYLSGGARIIFGSNNKANIFPSTNPNGFEHLNYAKRSHVHPISKEMGLKFLGIDSALTEAEITQRDHHHFSTWPMGTPDHAEIRHAVPFWRAIADTFDDYETHVMADRIATQISVTDIHFLNALNIYHEATIDFLKENENFDRIIGNTYTARFAAEIQGLLNDLYSLRNFLLSLYGKQRFSKAPVTGKLASKIEQEANQSDLDKLVLKGLEPNGPINTLSNYRDLIAHVLPMFSARSSFHIVRKIQLRGIVLPRIVFPIFDELLEAKTHVRGTKQLVNYELDLDYLKNVAENKDLTDALDFCHSAFTFLLEVGRETALQFRLKPKIKTITDKDIIEVSDFEIVNGTKKLRMTVKLTKDNSP